MLRLIACLMPVAVRIDQSLLHLLSARRDRPGPDPCPSPRNAILATQLLKCQALDSDGQTPRVASAAMYVA
jgi:hypothetical protein